MDNDRMAIVFDMGGVLLEWDPRQVYQAYFINDPQAIDAFLAEIGFYEWNVKQDGGRPFADGVAELSARFPHYADLIAAYDLRWQESIVGPIQGTVDILWALKQAGFPLYGLSNWSAEKFPLIRPKYEFFSWFDDILVSGEIKVNKPDPAIFYAFLKRIGRSAQDCLLIDDAAENIMVADELGFKTIWFRSPQELGQELRIHGVL